MARSVSPTDLAQKAFVRGLSYETDEDALRRAFSKFGEVVEGLHKSSYCGVTKHCTGDSNCIGMIAQPNPNANLESLILIHNPCPKPNLLCLIYR